MFYNNDAVQLYQKNSYVWILSTELDLHSDFTVAYQCGNEVAIAYLKNSTLSTLRFAKMLVPAN